MATVITDNKYYTDIAKAIRDIKGSVDTYKPSDMAIAIRDIKSLISTDITMTQSTVNGGQVADLFSATANSNAKISVLLYKRGLDIDNQVIAIGRYLFNDGKFYTFAHRSRNGNVGDFALTNIYDAVINIGDEYTLYEVIS